MGNSLYSSPRGDNTKGQHKSFTMGTVSGEGSAGTVVTCCSESAVE